MKPISRHCHCRQRHNPLADPVINPPQAVRKSGTTSNYGERTSKYAYASSNLNVAIWGAELAVGDGPGRIYVVEPMGPIENDPNLTDKKFPGNPTNSYRAKNGFTVVAEVKEWRGHPPDEIKAARERIEIALKNGAPIIED